MAFYVLSAILLSIGAANAQKVTRVCWGEYERLQECLVGGKSCELAPVSLDTTLSTGTEKEWPS